MPIPKISGSRLSPSPPRWKRTKCKWQGANGGTWFSSDLDPGLYPPPPPPSSAYPSRFRTPLENRGKRGARDNKTRPNGAFTAFTVHVIHLLFFSLPSPSFLLPRIGENPIQGAPSPVYFHPTCARVFRLSARARSHGGASRDISLRPKKGSRSHRGREGGIAG